MVLLKHIGRASGYERFVRMRSFQGLKNGPATKNRRCYLQGSCGFILKKSGKRRCSARLASMPADSIHSLALAGITARGTGGHGMHRPRAQDLSARI